MEQYEQPTSNREKALAHMRQDYEKRAKEEKTWDFLKERDPWGRGTILTVSLLGSCVSGGIITCLNWRRFGKPRLMWPSIIAPVIIFTVIPIFMPLEIACITGTAVSILFAWILWSWQKADYQKWKESHTDTRKAGWQIPLAFVIGIDSLFLIFVVGIVGDGLLSVIAVRIGLALLVLSGILLQGIRREISKRSWGSWLVYYGVFVLSFTILILPAGLGTAWAFILAILVTAFVRVLFLRGPLGI